jgi:hypothetical protein
MLIPTFIPKCVAFIGAPRDRVEDNKDFLSGTCFILLRKSKRLDLAHMYVVTARHVVNGTAAAANDSVFIRANTKDFGASWLETQKSDWITGDAAIDVAVLPFTFNSISVEFSCIPAQCHWRPKSR